MMTRVLLISLPALALSGSFTLYSEPIRLRPGEVHNRFGRPIPLPADIREQFKDKDMPLNQFSLDIIEMDAQTGAERSVPLYEMYNHHYIIHAGSRQDMERSAQLGAKSGCKDHTLLRAGAGSSTSFGGGTGAEFRGYPFHLPAPYAQKARGIEYVMPLLHVINIRTNASLLECPCSTGRVNAANGTIDGEPVKISFGCSDAFKSNGNPSCSLDTYAGGLRCCEDGVFLQEHPDTKAAYNEVRLKMTFGFRDEAEEEKVPTIEVYGTHCCDVTGAKYHDGPGGAHKAGGGGNIEYDIPKCAPGSPADQCVDVTSAVQTIDWVKGENPDELVELVQATGHVHKAAISLDLVDERNGAVVCHVTPSYGSSEKPGDEAGFLVGIKPCQWGLPPLQQPPRFRRSDLVRTVAKYNSTEAHTGVMSLWLLKVVPVNNSAAQGILV